MIIVKLMGGLGNQMFQYAAARRLSYVSGVQLKLDLSWFDTVCEGVTERNYQLHPFNIVASIATPAETAQFARPLGKIAGFARRYLPLGTSYLQEKHFHFDPAMLKPRRRAYLDGYWQNEKYFEDVKEVIARDFTFKAPPEGLNRTLAEEVGGSGKDNIALHIRRGDYVNNPAVANFHGACSRQYYNAAISMLGQLLDNPHFFIFSDDPDWVTANFTITHPFTVLGHNGPDRGWEDLRLMSLCKHHIIANSTFSWWGAWLAANPQKVVIAPRSWFNNANIDTKDLLPDSWIKI